MGKATDSMTAQSSAPPKVPAVQDSTALVLRDPKSQGHFSSKDKAGKVPVTKFLRCHETSFIACDNHVERAVARGERIDVNSLFGFSRPVAQKSDSSSTMSMANKQAAADLKSLLGIGMAPVVSVESTNQGADSIPAKLNVPKVRCIDQASFNNLQNQNLLFNSGPNDIRMVSSLGGANMGMRGNTGDFMLQQENDSVRITATSCAGAGNFNRPPGLSGPAVSNAAVIAAPEIMLPQYQSIINHLLPGSPFLARPHSYVRNVPLALAPTTPNLYQRGSGYYQPTILGDAGYEHLQHMTSQADNVLRLRASRASNGDRVRDGERSTSSSSSATFSMSTPSSLQRSVTLEIGGSQAEFPFLDHSQYPPWPTVSQPFGWWHPLGMFCPPCMWLNYCPIPWTMAAGPPATGVQPTTTAAVSSCSHQELEQSAQPMPAPDSSRSDSDKMDSDAEDSGEELFIQQQLSLLAMESGTTTAARTENEKSENGELKRLSVQLNQLQEQMKLLAETVDAKISKMEVALTAVKEEVALFPKATEHGANTTGAVINLEGRLGVDSTPCDHRDPFVIT